MADIKISQLGEALVVTDNDVWPMTASGVTNKVKASTMKSYMVDDLEVSDLYDTTITTPTDNDGLVYDSASQKWENVPIVTQAQNRVTGVHQFLYNRVKSAQVVGGLTITPNTDGSFTVGAGTATSEDSIMVSGTGSSLWSQAEQKLPVGNYYASCEGAVEGVYLRLNVEENNQQVAVRGTDVSITVSSAPSNTLAFIQVLSGTVIPVGGITIKPLIRLQSDSDKTIAPYAKTNRELTENEPQISLNGDGSTYVLKTIIIDDVCIFALKVKKTAASYTICACPIPLADEEIVGRVNINGTTADVVVLHDTNQGVLQIRSTETDSNWRYVSGVYRIA